MSEQNGLGPGYDGSETKPEEISLTDILDHSQLQGIFDDLTRMLGIAAAIIDMEGNIIIGSGWQKICTDFHRVCPETCRNCIESDTALTSGIEPGKSILYKCKNNLWDMATPVFVEGKKLGNMFIGQFLLEEEEPDIDVFKRQARECGFDEKEYLEALAKVPRISRAKTEWAMSFFVKGADYISELGVRNLQLARVLEKNSVLLEHLATSEALLKIAGHLVSLGGWQFDIAENRLIWSDEVAEIHEMPPGYTPNVDDGIGFYAPEYRERITEVFARCVEAGEPYDEKMQIITGTGRRVWVRTIGEAVRNGEGKIVKVQGGFQDISEQKMAEEALRRSEAQFRALVEGAPDAIYVHIDGRFVYLNETALRMYGAKSPEEILGRCILELFHPSMHDVVRERLHTINVERKSVPTMEQIHLRLDGGEIPVEVTSIPIIYDGKESALVFARDISERKEAREALRESEERFRSIFENATIGLYRTSPDGKILMANPKLVAMLGYSSFEELSSRNLDEVGFEPGFPRSCFQEMIDRDGEIRGLESAWTRRDGSVIFVRESARAIRDLSGRVLCYEGTVEDVTAQRRSEEELRKKEDLIRFAGKLASLGGWSVDLPGNRTVWTDEAARIHDLPSDYSADVEEAKGFYAPGSRALIDRVYAECVKNGIPYDEEFRKVTSTGRSIWVREIGEAVRDETGKIIRVQGAFQDITEWKRAEEFLRRSEEKYRQITENMSDVVWTADLGMNTTYVSPSVRKLLGETPEEHLVRGMRDKFPPEDLAKLMSVLEEELERERSGDAPKDRSRIVEVQHYRADGSLVWISMNLSFIRDEKGNPIGFQGVTRDITERRLVEAEYATLFHEMLDAFALHEIICDTDGKPVDYRFISVNPAFERMTGLRLNDVKGRTVLDILPDTESYWIEKYGHVALTGEPVFFENYATLFGKYFEVKAFSHVPGQFATIFTDITERKDAEEKLRRALERTILVLTQTVERRDPYTAGHQRRVSNLAATIAREMGLDTDKVEQIRISGYVHDLGKISVPAEILSKPGRLSELEMDIIREHPAHGRDILLDVESGWDLAEIVYQHHERLDGSGYPQGLKGEGISLEARILAVADVVEAMASYRPYRPAIGLKEALEEIETKSGILYDPEVVRVCLDLFREKGYQLEE